MCRGVFWYKNFFYFCINDLIIQGHYPAVTSTRTKLTLAIIWKKKQHISKKNLFTDIMENYSHSRCFYHTYCTARSSGDIGMKDRKFSKMTKLLTSALLTIYCIISTYSSIKLQFCIALLCPVSINHVFVGNCICYLSNRIVYWYAIIVFFVSHPGLAKCTV